LPVAVVALVLEAHRNAVFPEGPQFLSPGIVQLAFSLLAQKLHDLGAAGGELIAVAPQRILGIRQREPFGIAGVPGIFGRLTLLRRGLHVKRRARGSCGHVQTFPTGRAMPIC
jgi:hypothetical protein